MFRASVTANNLDLGPGAAAEILVDGSETPITANGLTGYTPVPGDRLIVNRVGNQIEVMQFVSVGTVPYIATPEFDQAVAGVVDSDYTFTGNLANANLTITEADGIDIPGLFTMPIGGAGEAHIVTHLVGKSATFEDNTNLRGLTTLEGEVLLQNGISAPAVAPTISSTGHLVVPTGFGDDLLTAPTVRGASTHISNPDQMVVTVEFFGSVWRYINPYTGVMDPFVFNAVTGDTALPASQRYTHDAKVTTIGSFYYILARRDSDFRWGIDKYDSTRTFVSNIVTNINPANEPAIGNDGTNLLFTWVSAANHLISRVYSPSTGLIVGSDKDHHTFSSAQDMRYVGKGLFDHSPFTRWYFQTVKGVTIATDDSVSPARQTAYEFPSPGGAWSYGLVWDGTRFIQFTNGGTQLDAVHYSTGRPSTQSVSAVYTWFDDVGTDHETTESPARIQNIPARTPFIVSTPPAPQAGGVGADVADEVNVYVGIGANPKYRQENLNVGVTSTQPLQTLLTAGSTPPLTNGFDLVGITPGIIHSGADDADGWKASIGGDGEWRLTGLGGRITDNMIVGPDGFPLFATEVYTSASTAAITGSTFEFIPAFAVVAGQDQGYFTGPSSGILTASVAGWYLVHAQANWAANVSGRRILRFTKNGAECWRDDRGVGTVGGNASNTTSFPIYLAVGDTIGIEVWHNVTGGGTLALATGATLLHRWGLTRMGVEQD